MLRLSVRIVCDSCGKLAPRTLDMLVEIDSDRRLRFVTPESATVAARTVFERAATMRLLGTTSPSPFDVASISDFVAKDFGNGQRTYCADCSGKEEPEDSA